MRTKLLAFIAVIGGAWSAGSFALPPRNVNVAVNRQEAMQSCVQTCQAHSKTPGACSSQCLKAYAPFYGPPTGIDTSTYNVVSCDVGAGAVWAWYAMCQVELGLLSDGVTSALSSLINNATIAQALMGKAKSLGDPCGYVRDQVLADYANRCPTSIVVPKPTMPPR